MVNTGPNPLPQRTPMEELARWGEPSPDDLAPHVTDPAAYRSPGRPPWAPSEEEPAAGLIAWTAGAVVVGLVALWGALAVILGPVKSGVEPAAEPVVTVTGTCDREIDGGYGLVGRVTVHNPTRDVQRGEVWIRWTAGWNEPQTFSRTLVLEPGGQDQHYVNERVNADEWFRVEGCDYGWTVAP